MDYFYLVLNLSSHPCFIRFPSDLLCLCKVIFLAFYSTYRVINMDWPYSRQIVCVFFSQVSKFFFWVLSITERTHKNHLLACEKKATITVLARIGPIHIDHPVVHTSPKESPCLSNGIHLFDISVTKDPCNLQTVFLFSVPITLCTQLCFTILVLWQQQHQQWMHSLICYQTFFFCSLLGTKNAYIGFDVKKIILA